MNAFPLDTPPLLISLHFVNSPCFSKNYFMLSSYVSVFKLVTNSSVLPSLPSSTGSVSFFGSSAISASSFSSLLEDSLSFFLPLSFLAGFFSSSSSLLDDESLFALVAFFVSVFLTGFFSSESLLSSDDDSSFLAAAFLTGAFFLGALSSLSSSLLEDSSFLTGFFSFFVSLETTAFF